MIINEPPRYLGSYASRFRQVLECDCWEPIARQRSCGSVQRVSESASQSVSSEIKCDTSKRHGARAGFWFGVGAHVIWGVVPIYFHAMADVPPWVVLCHRVIWSVAFLALVISVRREWSFIGAAMRTLRNLGLLSASAVLIAINWLLFIYAISSGQALQASMGYFMNPLLNVALGRIFLGERLRPWQWVAVSIALVSVINLSWQGAGFPWLAVSLALSFGFYGLVRKKVDLNSLHALMIESVILLPLAFVALMFCSDFAAWRPKFGLLSLSGVITAIPLLLFGAAVRRLKLSTMGFLQYVGPTLQFLVATVIFHEALDRAKLVSFGLCWVAIGVYVADTMMTRGKE